MTHIKSKNTSDVKLHFLSLNTWTEEKLRPGALNMSTPCSSPFGRGEAEQRLPQLNVSTYAEGVDVPLLSIYWR